jgi:hypothetical protein
LDRGRGARRNQQVRLSSWSRPFYRVDSNDKAKCRLGWQLRHPSWRQGFAEGLG